MSLSPSHLSWYHPYNLQQIVSIIIGTLNKSVCSKLILVAVILDSFISSGAMLKSMKPVTLKTSPYFVYRPPRKPPFYTFDNHNLMLLDTISEEQVGSTDTTKCYSCMSDVYLKAWKSLKYTYTKPMNFSEQCNDNYQQANIGVVDCPTICVVMIDETVIAGFSYFGFIRGCYDTILQSGFNQTIVQKDGWLRMNTCRRYDRHELLKLPHRLRHRHQSQNNDGGIWLCACYGDKCNRGVPRFNSRGSSLSPNLKGLSLTYYQMLAILLGLHAVLSRTLIQR